MAREVNPPVTLKISPKDRWEAHKRVLGELHLTTNPDDLADMLGQLALPTDDPKPPKFSSDFVEEDSPF